MATGGTAISDAGEIRLPTGEASIYGQFSPIAMAAESLATRWTMVVLGGMLSRHASTRSAAADRACPRRGWGSARSKTRSRLALSSSTATLDVRQLHAMDRPKRPRRGRLAVFEQMELVVGSKTRRLNRLERSVRWDSAATAASPVDAHRPGLPSVKRRGAGLQSLRRSLESKGPRCPPVVRPWQAQGHRPYRPPRGTPLPIGRTHGFRSAASTAR